MANPNLYKQRDRATEIRDTYLLEVKQLLQDRDLSDDGRKRRLADSYLKTRRQLDKLAVAEQENLASRQTSLERDLFGARRALGADAGTYAISARDASDRAAQIKTSDEARDVLRRAEADGDELLARAAVRQCVRASDASMSRQSSEKWDQVTRSYLDKRPNLEPVVEELAEIETMTKHQVFTPFSLTKPHGVEPSYFNNQAPVGPEGVGKTPQISVSK